MKIMETPSFGLSRIGGSHWKSWSPTVFCLLFIGFVWGPIESLAQIRRPELPSTSARGTVAGQVTDSRGRALWRVQVTARLDGTELSFGAISDRDGRFLIAGLPEGDYLLVASILDQPDLETPPRRFHLAVGGERTLNLEIAMPDTGQGPLRPKRRRPSGSPRAPEDPESFPPTLSVQPRPVEVPRETPVADLPGVEPEFRPLGNAGGAPATSGASPDFVPVDDRWRIGFPRWDRYANSRSQTYPYVTGRRGDPYNLNVLKGDYPIFGNNWLPSSGQ